MPPSGIDLHPEARAEALAAADWYAERSPSAAESFTDTIDTALAQIAEAPERWPRHLYGTRRHVLQRFPFSVIYRVVDTDIHVYAIAHAKRRPGYWRSRRFQ